MMESLGSDHSSSLEMIRLVVMMYIQFALGLRNAEELQFERGIGHLP